MTRLRALVGERQNTSPANAASWLVAMLVLAVAIPANAKIGKNAVFFAAHSFSPIAWVVLLLVTIALIWIVLWGVLTLAHRTHGTRASTAGTTGRAFDIVASTITVALATFLAANALAVASLKAVPMLAWFVGLLIGLTITVLARRFAMGTLLLGVSAIAMAIPLLNVATQQQQATTSPFTFAASHPRPNVLWIISDELSYPLVFDAEGKVRDEFPNLQALQHDSTTYTHAYTSSNHTDYAVPAQLTGVSDISALGPDRLQSVRASTGIVNGFSGTYAVDVVSPMFHVTCQNAMCDAAKAGAQANPFENAWVFTKDVAAITGRTVLAAPFVDMFPSLDGKWRDYWSSGDEFGENEPTNTAGPVIAGLRSLTEQSPQTPFFTVWHSLQTHGPYVQDADGKRMFPARVPIIAGARMAGQTKTETVTTDALETFDRRLYVYAAQDMDRQIGEVVAALKKLGRYDDTMIVFTSDHGVATTRTNVRRSGDNRVQRWSQIAHVPLMVKDPGQRQPAVVTGIRSTGQIAQTVLDVTKASPSQGPAVIARAPGLTSDLPSPPVFTQTFSRSMRPETYTALDEVDPWTSEDLTAIDPAHPFAIGIDPKFLGRPVPTGAVVQDATITAFPTKSTQELVVAQRGRSACGSQDVGLIVDNRTNTTIGSILWEGASAPRGWAIIPKTPPDDLRLVCTPQ